MSAIEAMVREFVSIHPGYSSDWATSLANASTIFEHVCGVTYGVHHLKDDVGLAQFPTPVSPLEHRSVFSQPLSIVLDQEVMFSWN